MGCKRCPIVTENQTFTWQSHKKVSYFRVPIKQRKQLRTLLNDLKFFFTATQHLFLCLKMFLNTNGGRSI